jgi:hypothetical protein
MTSHGDRVQCVFEIGERLREMAELRPLSFNVEVQWWSRRIVHLGWALKAMSLSWSSIEIASDFITPFLRQ